MRKWIPVCLALTLLTPALTACSSVGAIPDVKLTLADPLPVPHPAAPDPVTIHDMKWRSCGGKACVSVAAVKQSIKDRLSVAKWMGETDDLIRYYESVTPAK